MPYEYRIHRMVEFSETDMAGIVHFSNFFRWMESAEHAFFRSLGFVVHSHDQGNMLGWARLHASCDYHKPLKYGDEFDTIVQIVAKGSKTLDYAFRFERPQGDAGAELIAEAKMRVICVTRTSDAEPIRAIAIPPEVDACLEVAPGSDAP